MSLDHMFVQMLSLKHLIIYLPNMVVIKSMCANEKLNLYKSGIHDIQNYWSLITPPTKLLKGSILLFQIIISQNEILKHITTPT